MIKTPDPKSHYCAVVGCHKRAIGVLGVHEKGTDCYFVIPICDPHTDETNRAKKGRKRRAKK